MDYKKLYTPTELAVLYNTARIKYDPTSYSLKGNLIVNHSTEAAEKEHIGNVNYNSEIRLINCIFENEKKRPLDISITGLSKKTVSYDTTKNEMTYACVQQDNLYICLDTLQHVIDLHPLKHTNVMQTLITMCVALNSSKSCSKEILGLCLPYFITAPYSEVCSFEYLRNCLKDKTVAIPVFKGNNSVDVTYIPTYDSSFDRSPDNYLVGEDGGADSMFAQTIGFFETMWAWTTLPEELKTCFVALCNTCETTARSFTFFEKFAKLDPAGLIINPELENVISEADPAKRYTMYQDFLSKHLVDIYNDCTNFYKNSIPKDLLINPIIAMFTSFVLQVSLTNFRINQMRILYDYCVTNKYITQAAAETLNDTFKSFSKYDLTTGLGFGKEEEKYKSLMDFEDTKTYSKETAPDVDDTSHDSPVMYEALDKMKASFSTKMYHYDVQDVKDTDTSSKTKYDAVASKVDLINKLLIRRIRDIKTYNVGGKNPGRSSGRLDRKAMYRYKYDPNIFYDNSYKTVESDLAFGIILDESGSMSGKGIENGRITMIVLHETLKALGINHSIIGHTSDGKHHCEISRYQSFKEDKTYSTCKNYAIVKTTAKWGNCDSGALYYMEKAFERVTNKDKICLIFSDGAPTECTGTELRDQVRAMERKGIKVIGIGINFESIAKYYTDYANGRNLSDMLNIVAKILEEYVLKKKDK